MHKIKLNKVHYFLMETIQGLENKIDHLSYLHDSKGGDHYIQGLNVLNSVREFLTGGDGTTLRNEDYDFMVKTYNECIESGVWNKVEKPITQTEIDSDKLSEKLIVSELPVGELVLEIPEQVAAPVKQTKKKKTKVVI